MAGYDSGTATEVPARLYSLPGDPSFGRPSIRPMYEFLDELEDDEPFFLFLAPMLPHVPLDASAERVARYQAKGLSSRAVRYYANITRLDEVIGRMLDALAERGLREDTLIIYVSDNGWEQAPYRNYFLGSILGGDRGKLSIYELGFRTPLILSWPGRVPTRKVLDDLVTFEDLDATILRYAAVPIPPDHEGVDLVPRIEGWSGPARDQVIGLKDVLRVWQSEFIPGSGLQGVLRRERASFLRTDRWRYIEWLDRGEQALYRIEDDPFERIDVSGEHPDLLADFAQRTRRVDSAYGCGAGPHGVSCSCVCSPARTASWPPTSFPPASISCGRRRPTAFAR